MRITNLSSPSFGALLHLGPVTETSTTAGLLLQEELVCNSIQTILQVIPGNAPKPDQLYLAVGAVDIAMLIAPTQGINRPLATLAGGFAQGSQALINAMTALSTPQVTGQRTPVTQLIFEKLEAFKRIVGLPTEAGQIKA